MKETQSYNPEKGKFGRAVSRSITESLPTSIVGAAGFILLPFPFNWAIGGLSTIGEIRSGVRVWREEYGTKATRTQLQQLRPLTT